MQCSVSIEVRLVGITQCRQKNAGDSSVAVPARSMQRSVTILNKEQSSIKNYRMSLKQVKIYMHKKVYGNKMFVDLTEIP